LKRELPAKWPFGAIFIRVARSLHKTSPALAAAANRGKNGWRTEFRPVSKNLVSTWSGLQQKRQAILICRRLFC
jgi:hypothetical protein